MLLYASETRDKCRSDGQLGSNPDFTLPYFKAHFDFKYTSKVITKPAYFDLINLRNKPLCHTESNPF